MHNKTSCYSNECVTVLKGAALQVLGGGGVNIGRVALLPLITNASSEDWTEIIGHRKGTGMENVFSWRNMRGE